MTFKILFYLIPFLPIFNLIGQVNKSNLYTLEYSWSNDQKITFNHPQLITNFNSEGYNNHPFFLETEVLIFSSQNPNQIQPDLVIANLTLKTLEKLTQTTTGEYSSSLRNPSQKNLLSAIRMEFVESDTLVRLWELPIDGSSDGKPLFPEILYSGYHLWLNSSEVVLFEVGNPNQLVLRSLTDTSKKIYLTEKPGRCFKKNKNGEVIFLNQEKEILKFSPTTNQTTTLGSFPGNGQDFEILENDMVLASSNKKLFISNLNKIPLDWKEAMDLSVLGGTQITRIATNYKNKIALVVENITP